MWHQMSCQLQLYRLQLRLRQRLLAACLLVAFASATFPLLRAAATALRSWSSAAHGASHLFSIELRHDGKVSSSLCPSQCPGISGVSLDG
jgi:hypothetical protein